MKSVNKKNNDFNKTHRLLLGHKTPTKCTELLITLVHIDQYENNKTLFF